MRSLKVQSLNQNVTVQEKTVPENTGVDSGDDAGVEQTAESSEDSSETSLNQKVLQVSSYLCGCRHHSAHFRIKSREGIEKEALKDLSKRICTGNVKISR